MARVSVSLMPVAWLGRAMSTYYEEVWTSGIKHTEVPLMFPELTVLRT